MSHEKVKISDLTPNPFRNIDNYPIQEEKIQQLITSYKQTGFWGNIVARKRGKKVEIAYGHHRLEALKKYPGLKASDKVSIIIQNLDDEKMLKIMANENMQEWRSSAEVAQETVRAVVQAYADGKIELEEPKKKGQEARYAPSFILGKAAGDGAAFAYNRYTIGKFLGWNAKYKVQPILQALAQEEEKILPKGFAKGLGQEAAEAISSNVSKIQNPYNESAKEWEEKAETAIEEGDTQTAKKYKQTAKKRQEEGKKAAQNAAKWAHKQLKKGEISTREIPQAVRGFAAPKNEKPHDIEDVAYQVVRGLNKILSEEYTATPKLEEIIKWKKTLDNKAQEDLYEALVGLSSRAVKFANKLRKKSDSKPKVKLLKGEN